MSPCSTEGHCYRFAKDLKVPLGSDSTRSEVLTACYLEDGRIVAQGVITIKTLVRISAILAKSLCVFRWRLPSAVNQSLKTMPVQTASNQKRNSHLRLH